MPYWLVKSEPSKFSWDQFVKDKQTVWDGVRNYAARIHLRTMKKGDEALIYHTGDERAAVGIADITSAPHPDPSGESDKLVVVDIKPRKKLAQPVTLSDIKADPAFAGWDLLRIGRLSVVPVPRANELRPDNF